MEYYVGSSSLIRDRTWPACIGSAEFSYWTNREVPVISVKPICVEHHFVQLIHLQCLYVGLSSTSFSQITCLFAQLWRLVR